MTPEATLLVGILLFVATASGYFIARYRGRGEGGAGGRTPDKRYLRGLRYLVDEQPDKAIEVFTKLLDVDSDTLEIHFALGNLFRKRGETERAIRVHQNIIARPELPRIERERALFALGEDYLKAGLLDRAEKLFLEVSATQALRTASYSNLVNLYEQQKDWEQAIKCRRQLTAAARAGGDAVTAHYYCELARERLDRDDAEAARKFLRKAKSENPDGVRGALMRAELAERCNDHKLARNLLMRVTETHPQFAVLAITRLASSCRVAGEEDKLPGHLEKLLGRSPDLLRPIAHAAILDRRIDDPVSLRCLTDYVRSDRILGAILEAMEAEASRERAISGPETLRRIRLVLRRLALDGPRFGCLECGFTSRSLEWRCPSCLAWDTTLPTANLKFDSHLGSSGYIQ